MVVLCATDQGEADRKLIAACDKITELGVGGIDPFNKKIINGAENAAAINASVYFQIQMASKIDEISDFMEANYYNSHKVSGMGNDDEAKQYENYLNFRLYYMRYDEATDTWLKNDKWRKDPSNGNVWLPYTIEEVENYYKNGGQD